MAEAGRGGHREPGTCSEKTRASDRLSWEIVRALPRGCARRGQGATCQSHCKGSPT